MRLVAILFATALFAPSTARADQCAYNDLAIVEKAADLAKKSTKWLEDMRRWELTPGAEFWGKLVRAEATGQKGDPACVTVVDISGQRVPQP